MDWKKEYRMSDLGRRKDKAEPPATEPDPQPDIEPTADAAKQSLLKKEIHLFGRRKSKGEEPAEQVEVQTTAGEEPAAEEPAAEATVEEQPDAAATVAASSSDEESTWSKAAEPTVEQPPSAPLEAATEPDPQPDIEPTADAAKQSLLKKEIHLFGRRKSKGEEPAEQVEVQTTAGEEPAAEATVEEQPELPDSSSAEHEPEPPQVQEPAEALAAASATSEEPASEELPAGPVPSESGPASVRQKGSVFGKRGGRKDAEESTPGGPDRREKVPRRDRSAEDRAARSEARGGRPGALPDVPLFHAINLLPREEAKVRRQGPSLQQLAVAVIGLVMLGMLSFVFVLERARVQDRQAEVKKLDAKIAAIATPPGTDGSASTTEVAGELITRAGTLSVALDGRIVWDRLLRQLSLVLPADVWFEDVTSGAATVSSTTDGTTAATGAARASMLTIKGYARTQQGVAELLGRLGVLPQFDLVQLQSGELVERGGEEVVQFTVAATLKPEGGVTS